MERSKQESVGGGFLDVLTYRRFSYFTAGDYLFNIITYPSNHFTAKAEMYEFIVFTACIGKFTKFTMTKNDFTA